MNAILSMPGYFREKNDPETNTAIREDFLRALAMYPDWAVQRAFDAWVRTGTRMPSPGEMVILASRETKPLHEELLKRKRVADEQAEDERRRIANRVSAESAARIMAEAGMTPERLAAVMRAPMAGSLDEAEAIANPPSKPHWTESVADPETDPRMVALRASRASSLVAGTSPEVIKAAEADRLRQAQAEPRAACASPRAYGTTKTSRRFARTLTAWV